MTLRNHDPEWDEPLPPDEGSIFGGGDMNEGPSDQLFEGAGDSLSNILTLSGGPNENGPRIPEVRGEERAQFQEYHDEFKDIHTIAGNNSGWHDEMFSQ